MVTGESVAAGKPAPDAYELAASLLDVAPQSCIAIEDSPTGASSAEAAGALVLVVPNHVDVPLTRGRVLVPTLEGVSVADLSALFDEHRAD
jgi:beta-phosphoglucomutase-like phosphatase (HAD superfamily)